MQQQQRERSHDEPLHKVVRLRCLLEQKSNARIDKGPRKSDTVHAEKRSSPISITSPFMRTKKKHTQKNFKNKRTSKRA